MLHYRTILLAGLLTLLTALAFHTGCKKEYSYEGSTPTDTTVIPDLTNNFDSAQNNAFFFPQCPSCKSTNTVADFQWAFTINGSYLCGIITRGILSAAGDAMTFFGPSTCSEDTGIVITAFFSTQPLNSDKRSLVADRAAFQYYDNTSQSDILHSKQPNPFVLTITDYNRSTGMATGTFNGSVLAKNGDIIKVEKGSFKVRFD